ncbi:hypothetical protein PsorP6_015639 [Peronosclerospora sorghi]|uniref:Uncharacterized protein n=1 Tax=Peronosclerospora sorghi TaxID=230839 RepID=A0ACC0WMT1_9STRA|nr:hypothetical protein PsorP6_015639 [Peronosclerospora sorghi]
MIEEVVQPVAEVSKVTQAQLTQRVHSIIDAIRPSLILQDALRLIISRYKATPSANGLALIDYGLRRFCASSNALHQLGFLVAVKRALDQQLTQVSTSSPDTCHPTPLSIEIFDPAMNKSYAVIAEHFSPYDPSRE